MTSIRKYNQNTPIIQRDIHSRRKNSDYFNIQTLEDRRPCDKTNTLLKTGWRNKEKGYGEEGFDLRVTQVCTPMSVLNLCVLPIKSFVRAKPPQQSSFQRTYSPLRELAATLYFARLKLFTEKGQNKQEKKVKSNKIRSKSKTIITRRLYRRSKVRNESSICSHEEIYSNGCHIPIQIKNYNRKIRLTNIDFRKMGNRKYKNNQTNNEFKIRIVVNKKNNNQ